MSTLPDINEFTQHKLKFASTNILSSEKNGKGLKIDLDKFHTTLINRKHIQQEMALMNSLVTNPTQLLYEMFSQKFLRSFSKPLSPIFRKYLGYSKKYQSLSISVFDKYKKVQAIAIQKATTQDNLIVKWKSYGSKTFISCKIKDDFIFVAVGMKELVLLEMMDVSYIHLQSDSMVRHISKEIISQTIGKNLVILEENDESFKKVSKELQNIFKTANIFAIDYEIMLGKELQKGYDFVDFCNELEDIGIVEKQLENEILKQIKDTRC